MCFLVAQTLELARPGKACIKFQLFCVTEIKYFQKNLSKWKELLLIQNSHENVVILGNLQKLILTILDFLFGLLFPKTRQNTNKEKQVQKKKYRLKVCYSLPSNNMNILENKHRTNFSYLLFWRWFRQNHALIFSSFVCLIINSLEKILINKAILSLNKLCSLPQSQNQFKIKILLSCTNFHAHIKVVLVQQPSGFIMY